jgi:hypothetical protein
MPEVVYNACYGGFEISKKGLMWMAERGHTKAKGELENRGREDISRHDPLLIEMYKTLGSKTSSGPNSELKIKTIIGNKYFITEYDGIETVLTNSNIKWQYIN